MKELSILDINVARVITEIILCQQWIVQFYAAEINNKTVKFSTNKKKGNEIMR